MAEIGPVQFGHVARAVAGRLSATQQLQALLRGGGNDRPPRRREPCRPPAARSISS